MEHDEEYGDMMNELINIFIPPEDATREELDTAKKNMEKYADYRTYLSFDMQQIIHGEKDMKIGLSKMIKKIPAERDRIRCISLCWQVLHRSTGSICHRRSADRLRSVL